MTDASERQRALAERSYNIQLETAGLQAHHQHELNAVIAFLLLSSQSRCCCDTGTHCIELAAHYMSLSMFDIGLLAL